MPAARGVKRSSSRASNSGAAKSKRKQAISLDIPARGRVKCRLLTCGQGDVGQLGLGEDVMETNKFKEVTVLGNKIVDACAGGMHTVALDSDGNVWTFGCNDEGALGRQTSGPGVEEGLEMKPLKVKLPGKAVQISAGDSHTAALLENGQVYLWGAFRDSHGSMGLVLSGGEGKSSFTPIKLSLPELAAGIASGGDHVCILLKSGAIYTAGCGEQGQLGRLTQRSANRDARHGLSALLVPTAINSKTHFGKIWAGYHATLASEVSSNKVYAWGLNNYNQLGVTSEKKKEPLFRPEVADAFTVAAMERDVSAWQSVSCGQHHSIVLDDHGDCYAVGRCDYGRLGLGGDSGDSATLALITKLESLKCRSVAASTSSSFAVTENGELYAWGMGSEGQLGLGSEEDQNEPKLVISKAFEGKKAHKVSAGGQHTVLLLADTLDVSDTEEQPEAEESTDKVEEQPPKKRKKKVENIEEDVEDEEKMDSEVSSTTAVAEVSKEVTVDKKPTEEKKAASPTPMETDITDETDATAKTKDEVAKMETQETPEEPPAPKEVTEEKKPEAEAPKEEKVEEVAPPKEDAKETEDKVENNSAATVKANGPECTETNGLSSESETEKVATKTLETPPDSAPDVSVQ